MVSLYVHGHKSFKIDAWMMDSISCKFPICFTWLQNELEENMQYWEVLTEKWEASTCGTTACEATIGNEGKVSFSWISLRIQKANWRKGNHLQWKYNWLQGLSPKWFWFILSICKGTAIPMLNYGVFTDQTVGFPVSLFLLSHFPFVLSSFHFSFPPSYVCKYYFSHFMRDLGE